MGVRSWEFGEEIDKLANLCYGKALIMQVINSRNNAVIADKAKLANTCWSRLIGLLNRQSLEKGEALILKPACSIHSLFMRFTIDVLFLNKHGEVIAMHPSFKPFRISPIYFNSSLIVVIYMLSPFSLCIYYSGEKGSAQALFLVIHNLFYTHKPKHIYYLFVREHVL